MHLIIGGAYQGKLDYALSHFKLAETDLFTCTDSAPINFSRRCINHLEAFALGCVRRGEDPVSIFQAVHPSWADSILICEDIFCGVVPIEREMRAWRETTGRLAAYLAGEAETVTRLFCGLPQRLK